MVKKIIKKIHNIERRTDIIPFVLSRVLVSDIDAYQDEDEEDAGDIHFGIVSMAATIIWFAAARVALSAVILLLA